MILEAFDGSPLHAPWKGAGDSSDLSRPGRRFAFQIVSENRESPQYNRFFILSNHLRKDLGFQLGLLNFLQVLAQPVPGFSSQDDRLIHLLCLYRKSSMNGKNANYISEDDFEFPKLIPIRA